MVKQKAPSPSALQLVTCKAKVRRGGKQEQCGKQYIKAAKVCPDAENHLLAMRTGYCANGWHEGQKTVTWKGDPAPSCKFYITCPCSCHDELGKLFEMTGKERILVDVSAYQPPERDYWMPEDDPLPVLSRAGDPTPPVVIESPAPDRVPPTLARAYGPTPSGRSARGELESLVKKYCDIWVIDYEGEYDQHPCTPVYLANEISRGEAITAPSVGAISAVFDRWVKLGFAETAKKPTRFLRYTPDGIRLGLDRMKENAKRAKRLNMAEHRRNSIR